MIGKVCAALFGAVFILVAGSVLMEGSPVLEAAPAKDSKAVAARKKLMQANGKAMKGISAAVKAGELPKVALLASEIGENALDMKDAFEKKDMTGKTTALPKIWSEKAKFDQMATKLLNDSRAVIEAAREKNKAKVAAAVKTMGANCGACHKAYRVQKKK